MCKTEGCNTQPNFNIEGLKKALYCGSCKTTGMVDVKHKTCFQENCNTDRKSTRLNSSHG